MNESSGIVIRQATKHDIPIIRKLAEASWPVAYQEILSTKQLAYMLELIYSEQSLNEQFDAGHTFLIVEEDNQPVAFASYNMLKPGVYKLQKIYALPQQQGKGIGKLLVNHTVEILQSAGAASLLLNVNRYNKAKQFYEHIGFTVIGEEDIDIGEGYFMNDFIMEKKINQTHGTA